jgi:hypothetical protein
MTSNQPSAYSWPYPYPLVLEALKPMQAIVKHHRAQIAFESTREITTLSELQQKG